MWIWLVLFLEHMEAVAAALGLTDLAGQLCRIAVAFGMIGPCQP